MAATTRLPWYARTATALCLCMGVGARAEEFKVSFDGGCGAGDMRWNCPLNWTGDMTPNNNSPIDGDTYIVTLDNDNPGNAGARDNPILDSAGGPVAVTSLTLLGSAVLGVESTNLTVVEDMTLDDNSRFFAPDTANASANLTVMGTLSLLEGDTKNEDEGGRMLLGGGMSLAVGGELFLDGSTYSGGPGSCTPPDLVVGEGAGVKVEGFFSILNAAQISYTSSTPMCLAGKYNNLSKFPGLVNFTQKKLELRASCADDGIPGPPPIQQFEVAGTDLGAVLAGFVENYALAELRVEADHFVEFIDQFDNNDQPDTCGEALYVGTLILEKDAVITVDNASIYYINLINKGGTIQFPDCGVIQGISLDGVPSMSGWGTLFLTVALMSAGGGIAARRRRGSPARSSNTSVLF